MARPTVPDPATRAQPAIEKAKSKAKGDEKQGYDIVSFAVESCLKQIVDNAGLNGDLVVEKVKELPTNQGFNVITGEYTDLVKAGIIDPAKVAKTALINAASVAGLMLTTTVMISELKEDAEPVIGAVS